jgi:hypothetical protein
MVEKNIENQCYWTSVSRSTSKEGLAFQNMFNIDYEKCRNSCPGYENCARFLSIKDINKIDLIYYKK